MRVMHLCVAGFGLGLLTACSPLNTLTYGGVYKLREHVVMRDEPTTPHAWDCAKDFRFNQALDDARALPWLHSLLILQGGDLVGEYYASGFNEHSVFNIKSASKSIIALTTMQAIEAGDLGRLDTRILDYKPERCGPSAPGFEAMTIGDLLSMSGGLDDRENVDFGIWTTSDWLCAAYETPLKAQPGEAFSYSTAQTFLIGAALESLDQKPLHNVLEDRLLSHLDIQIEGWAEGPEGTGFGGSQLWLTARDMALIGQVVLNDGQYQGEQLITKAGLDSLTTARFDTHWGDREYAMGWWRGEISGQAYILAAGFGGQYIYIFKDLDLVIVTTASTPILSPLGPRTEDLEDLIAREILAHLIAAD